MLLTTSQISERWGISTRRVRYLAESGRIEGAIYKNKKWYFSEDAKKPTSDSSEENFVKIQWKEDEFTDIKINSKYEVSIKNKTGFYERPGDLSDGEKLCLGLCFMAAIHKVSGFNLPIIMDTPLGNLGPKMKHNIAEFIPQIESSKQTVLLVTDSEYTDDFKDTLGDNVGLEYRIEWNNSDEGKESQVVLDG